MIEFENKNGFFVVSNDFVDKYLCDANGSFVKVYLYALRHCGNKSVSLADAANDLNLLESDVVRSFKYWHKQGIIDFKQHSAEDYSVKFLSEHREDAEYEPVEHTHRTRTFPTAVMYTKSDINNYMKNNDGIRHMFMISSQLLNRTLSDTDRKILFSLYDYLKLPIEVIFTLLEYCVSMEKTNMRYIEKVAYTWADNDITTLPKASAFVKEQTEVENTFKHYKEMFKITGREFTDTEEEYIKKWVYQLKLDDDTIKQAYEITVSNTGKVAFKYMDAILQNCGKPRVAGSSASKTEPQSVQKKNAFQDYDDEMSDFDVEIIKNRMSRTKN